MNTIINTFAIIFLITGLSAAQNSRTNLEVFYSLLDSSVSMLPERIEEGRVAVYTGNNALLYNHIIEKINQRYGDIKIADSDFELSYVLENIRMNYGEIFRKKFLGDYFIERNFLLEGNAVISGNYGTINFNLAYSDTVLFDELSYLENELHPFTRAAVPAEPLFQGIIEPVVAIGTAAAAVVLFFLIRSR
jgi:hypothetical protein